MLRIKSLLFILSALCFIPAQTAVAQTQPSEAAGKRLEKAPASFETLNPFTRQPQKVILTREAFGEAVRVMLYIPEFSRWLPLLAHQAAQGEFALFATVAFQSMRTLDDQIARGMHFSVVCAEDMQFITAAEAERRRHGDHGRVASAGAQLAAQFQPRRQRGEVK